MFADNTPVVLDPSQDLLHQARPHPLDVFFRPRSVAVIGATETPGSVGRTLLTNLIGSPFGGTVYPVNPKRHSVLGIRAYPNVADVPEAVDLAVIVTPAAKVPGVIRECAATGVRGAIVISAGFKEVGPEGAVMERQVLHEARQANLRIVGPNCLGVMSPLTGLNATFAQGMARPGQVAFLSQSGALLTAVLDHALREQIGFSACASLGSMLDVGWDDLIDYLGNDPRTGSIVLYMESIGNDARAFLSAAREVALSKPIIVIKAGRTAIGAKAAASHTGALTGSDAVLDAAFARAGVLRVDSISDVFALTETLAKQPQPRGNCLTIVTNAGGPGVLATDALISSGGALSEIGGETLKRLNSFLPAAWSHSNPIDILGDAPPDRYAQALETAAADPNGDALLVVLTPQAMTDPTVTAEKLCPYAKTTGKPVLASWMGGASVAAGEAILTNAGIPTFAYPDEAVGVFNRLWRYSDNLRALYETPSEDNAGTVDSAAASSIVERVRSLGRALLTEYESKQILSAYGIPTVTTALAATPDEAVYMAESIGFPVVLKLHSETIAHKTDVNGVHLNLIGDAAVRKAFEAIREGVQKAAGDGHFLGVTVQPMVKLEGYELILGASPDPQFGPVLLFGTGGQLVEVYQDRALGLPPLTSTLAHQIMEKTRIYRALQGVRGRAPVDMSWLEEIFIRFARLVTEQRWIREIDINPLVAGPDGILALDARVVLYGVETAEPALPRPAIRPYPSQYAAPVTLRDGTRIQVRPIRPDDESRLVAFHQALSDTAVGQRYQAPFPLSDRTAHERLIRVTQADYDRELPLIALDKDQIIGIARLSRQRGGMTVAGKESEATFTLIVSDNYQNRGIGTGLLQVLLRAAKAEGISTVSAGISSDNLVIPQIVRALGGTVTPEETGDGSATVSFAL